MINVNALSENVNRSSENVNRSSENVNRLSENLNRFPYKKLFVKESPQLLFSRLCKDQDLYTYDEKTKICLTPDHVYEHVNILTDLFTEYARVRACVVSNVSPYHVWKTSQKEVKTLSMKLYGNTNTKSLRETLYSMTHETGSFSLSMARGIYDITLQLQMKLQLQKQPNKKQETFDVFDPFSGWGDRAIAALSCPFIRHYTGVDCNLELKKGYNKISKVLDCAPQPSAIHTAAHTAMQSFAKNIAPQSYAPHTSKKIEWNFMTIQEYCKNAIQKGKQFDYIFTSPPYYNYELYSKKHEHLQSYFQKSTYTQWLAEFYEPMLCDLVKLVKKGGLICLHIGTTFCSQDMPSDTQNMLVNKLGLKLIDTIYCARRTTNKTIAVWIYQNV